MKKVYIASVTDIICNKVEEQKFFEDFNDALQWLLDTMDSTYGDICESLTRNHAQELLENDEIMITEYYYYDIQKVDIVPSSNI